MKSFYLLRYGKYHHIGHPRGWRWTPPEGCLGRLGKMSVLLTLRLLCQALSLEFWMVLIAMGAKSFPFLIRNTFLHNVRQVEEQMGGSNSLLRDVRHAFSSIFSFCFGYLWVVKDTLFISFYILLLKNVLVLAANILKLEWHRGD